MYKSVIDKQALFCYNEMEVMEYEKEYKRFRYRKRLLLRNR